MDAKNKIAVQEAFASWVGKPVTATMPTKKRTPPDVKGLLLQANGFFLVAYDLLHPDGDIDGFAEFIKDIVNESRGEINKRLAERKASGNVKQGQAPEHLDSEIPF